MDELRLHLEDFQNQKVADPTNATLHELERQCKQEFMFWSKAARSYIL